jgi:hypothetical protein
LVSGTRKNKSFDFEQYTAKDTFSGRFTPPTIAKLFPAALLLANSASFFESSALRSKKELALTPLAFALLAWDILNESELWLVSLCQPRSYKYVQTNFQWESELFGGFLIAGDFHNN